MRFSELCAIVTDRGGAFMKIIKVNTAKNSINDLSDAKKMILANSSLDACGCTGNGQC